MLNETRSYVALNGNILPETDAGLSPLDRGFLYGDGLFETLKVKDNRIYFFDKHLERFREASRTLQIPIPTYVDLRETVLELLEANRIRGEASVKICLSRGRNEGRLAFYKPPSPTLLVLVRPFESPTHADWTRGLTVTLEREILQNPTSTLCRIKSLNYLLYLLVRTRAEQEGYDDAILSNTTGQVCECTTSNLFFFRRGRLETPQVTCGLLPGILRSALIECVQEAGVPFQEVRLQSGSLETCDEIFVTNSLLEILPVGRVDQRVYDRRERTRQLWERFRAFRDARHGS
jgi:branched-chain amino acid aminotransferase